MKNQIDKEAIREEFNKVNPIFNSLCHEVSRQIEIIIEKNSIHLAVPIQFRAKNLTSIIAKNDQGRFTIKKSITELQDLAGLRIITLFRRDANIIKKIISENFDLVKEYNAEDKLSDSEFGYSSTHLIIKLKEAWTEIPSFNDFRGLLLEVQIRTLSQHSWAEASNILQYKNESNIPKPLKKSISRVSALLETVDLEFERLLIERTEYIKEIEKEEYNENTQILDVDILRDILQKKLPKEHFSDRDDFSILLDNLKILDVDTSEKLISLIDRYLTLVMQENDEICEGFRSIYKIDKRASMYKNYDIGSENIAKVIAGYYFSYSGIIRQMLSHKLGKSWNIVYHEIKNKSNTNF